MSAKFKILQFIASSELVGLRIDKALGSLPEIGSRSRAESLISEGLVLRSGVPVKSSHRIEIGDLFEIKVPEYSESATPVGTDLPLEIIFQDSDVVVINKPARLVVHPAPGHADDTLVNALIFHVPDLAMGFGEIRPGIVHRIDKDTSGLLVIAKNDFAQENLVQQFKRREIHRIYHALTVGKLSSKVSNLGHVGTITSTIARHPTHRKKFASLENSFMLSLPTSSGQTERSRQPPLHSHPLAAERVLPVDPAESSKGKWARTNFRVLESLGDWIHYLELKLETGRTHQIRVHLSEAGIPIAGDELYGGRKKILQVPNPVHRKILTELPRFALHARDLGFRHPRTNEFLNFQVDWPQDVSTILKDLGLVTEENP